MKRNKKLKNLSIIIYKKLLTVIIIYYKKIKKKWKLKIK